MRYAIGTLALFMIFLGGCSSAPKFENADKASVKNLEVDADSDQSGWTNPSKIRVGGVDLRHVEFDVPITINTQVRHWVKYFTGRGRDRFRVYLKRSEYFIPFIDKILAEEKMPRDLVYLAMIESGFNNNARSRARAVGPWQFMRWTGRHYGLRVNWWVDERRDIEKSTRAAIAYLSHLYKMMGSWELAMSGYNAGEAKIVRAVNRYGTRDFFVLARHRYLKLETRNYVPKFIAAALIAKNRTQFGFAAQYVKPEDSYLDRKVRTPAANSLERRLARHTTGAAQTLEPKNKENTALLTLLDDHQKEKTDTGVPPASLVSHEEASEAIVTRGGSLLLTPHVSRRGKVGGVKTVEVEVQGPADLFKVARAAGISYRLVKQLNPEVRRWCTPPEFKTYKLKLPTEVKDRFLLTYNHPAFPRQIQFRTYKVRKGDSIRRIARRFGIRTTPIRDLNGLGKSNRLRRGRKILLPMPGDRKVSYSTLDLRDPPRKRRRYRRRRRSAQRAAVFRPVTYLHRSAARTPANRSGI